MFIVAGVLLFVSVIVIVLWGFRPNSSGQLIRQRVLSELSHEANRTMFDQVVEWVAPINRWLPTGWYSASTQGKLQAAGLKLSSMHFLVLQEIGALTGFVIYLVTLGFGKVSIPWLFILMVGGCFVPSWWVTNRIRSRRMSISRDLPEVVDLLNLCIDAGLDFMSSLGRVVREFRPCPTTEELGIVIQEVRVGKRRREALRAFAIRVQTAEARSFSRMLRQADRMGTGLGDALRILSEDMRVQQYHWAERFAQQAPLKMLLPLLFSLAAALIIVAGPIMVDFMKGGFTTQAFNAKDAMNQ